MPRKQSHQHETSEKGDQLYKLLQPKMWHAAQSRKEYNNTKTAGSNAIQHELKFKWNIAWEMQTRRAEATDLFYSYLKEYVNPSLTCFTYTKVIS